MIDIDDFEAVFKAPHDKNHGGYPSGLQEEIERSRQHLGGKLFFDRLLELLQIKVGKLYPPRSGKEIRELYKRIIDAPTLTHNKYCLLFYILKDLSPSTHTEPELASGFATSVHLPTRYWTFLEGLWSLDRLNFETAVGCLTHPTIIPTFPDEIMDVLLKHVDDDQETMKDNLPMAYYLSAKPPLMDEHVRDEFLKYMVRRDLTGTFYWIRARPDFERKYLFELLIDRCLSWRIGATKAGRADTAEELVELPFNDEEEEWFEEYLVEGQGRNLPCANDTVMVRRIATGRIREAAEDHEVKKRTHDHLNWDVLKDGLKRGLGPRGQVNTPFQTS